MPTRFAWLTPDTIPAETICRELLIPNEPQIIAAVNGALLRLTDVSQWEQFGTVTPAAMAAAMAVMFDGFQACQGQQSMVELAKFRHTENQNVGGGTVTANIFNRIPWTLQTLGASWISFDNANDQFTVQPGRYLIELHHATGMTSGFSYTQLERSNQIALDQGSQYPNAQMRQHHATFYLNLENQDTVQFSLFSNVGLANTGFGAPKNVAGNVEWYGHVVFARLGDF